MSTNNQSDGADMEIDTLREQVARLAAERDAAEAEVEMLRGVGCNEDGDGPCGACLKCARASAAQAERERDKATEALERFGFRRCDVPACNCRSYHPTRGVAVLKADLDESRARVEELEGALRRLVWQTSDHHFQPDHACAECVPGGEIVVPGFQCGRHAAARVLSSPGSRKEGANG